MHNDRSDLKTTKAQWLKKHIHNENPKTFNPREQLTELLCSYRYCCEMDASIHAFSVVKDSDRAGAGIGSEVVGHPLTP